MSSLLKRYLNSFSVFAIFLIVLLSGCHPKVKRQIELCTIKGPTELVGLAGESDFFWHKPNKLLKVWFMDDDGNMADEIMSFIKEWTSASGIRFAHANSVQESDIRVTFRGNGWWSYIGSYAKNIAKNKPTICLDTLYAFDMPKRKTVILHEFGHSLGLIHEHQSKNFDYEWNLPALYAYYKKTYAVDSVWVKDNVIAKDEDPQAVFCQLDLKSIMIYEIPDSLLIKRVRVPEPKDLSVLDKKYIALFYQGKDCNGNPRK